MIIGEKPEPTTSKPDVTPPAQLAPAAVVYEPGLAWVANNLEHIKHDRALQAEQIMAIRGAALSPGFIAYDEAIDRVYVMTTAALSRVRAGKRPDSLSVAFDMGKPLIVRLTEALRELFDNQNGPPLPSYELTWTQAMEEATAVLKIAEPLVARLKYEIEP